jgi:hypothetical protein
MVALGTYRILDLHSLYAFIQIGFCWLYFICSIFLDTGFTIGNTRVSAHNFVFGLLVFDFARRVVFVGLGSSWVYQEMGYTAMEILNSRLFYRIAFLPRMVCIHILFSVVIFLIDGLGLLYMIFYFFQAPVEEEKVVEEKEIEMEELFTEKRVSLDVCAICSEDMQDAVESKACGHIFHKECIKEWIHNQPTCPLCRSNFVVVVVQ